MKRLAVVAFFLEFCAFGRGKMALTRVLRSTVIHNPPFETIEVGPNGTRNYVGNGRNSLDWLALKLNLSIDFVYPSPELFKERSVEASIDLLVNGEADMTSTGYYPTTERLQNADTTTFFAWEEGYRMIVPRPGEEHRLFAFVRPFQLSVWLLLGASTVATTIGMGLLAWCYGRFFNTRSKRSRRPVGIGEHFSNYLTYNINMLTNHGDYLRESRFASYLMLTSCWLVGAAVLVYGYSSVVVSSLTLPRTKPTVDSLEDVLASKDVSLLLRTDFYPGKLIMNLSESPLHVALRDKVKRDPKALVNDYARLDKLLQTGKYASPFVDTFVRYYIGARYVKEKTCQFKLSAQIPSIANSHFYYFFRKGNRPLARQVSLRMMELWETGLGRYWVKNSLFKADECFAPDVKRPLANHDSIELADLTSAFFILAVGLSLSALSFLCERMYYSCISK